MLLNLDSVQTVALIVSACVIIPMVASFVSSTALKRDILLWPITNGIDFLIRKMVFHRWIVDGWKPYGGLGLTKASVRFRSLFSTASATAFIMLAYRFLIEHKMFWHSSAQQTDDNGYVALFFIISIIGTYWALYQVFLGEFVSKFSDLKYMHENFAIGAKSFGPRTPSTPPPQSPPGYSRYRFLDTALCFRLEDNQYFKYDVALLIKEILETRASLKGDSWEKFIAPFENIKIFLETKPDNELKAYRDEAMTVVVFMQFMRVDVRSTEPGDDVDVVDLDGDSPPSSSLPNAS